MRLHTRLFVGTALLVLAVLGFQLWLQVRQLRRIERGLGEVATTVGKAVLELPHMSPITRAFAVAPRDDDDDPTIVQNRFLWTEVGQQLSATDEKGTYVLKAVQPPPPPAPVAKDLKGTIAEAEAVIEGPSLEVWAEMIELQLQELERNRAELSDEEAERTMESAREAVERWRRRMVQEQREQREAEREKTRTAVEATGMRVDLKVVRDRADRMLVIRGVPGGEEKIPLPVTDTMDLVQSNVRSGVLAGGALLVLGLVGAAVIARGVAHPLSGLAEGARRVGGGELGVTVPVSGPGEVGDLERAFNEMSVRLENLEAERERWQAREHLAELGNVARGLAHTLRNPLNALGLAVEELSGNPDDRTRLAATARDQIRRIDRWMRSFLAVSASDEAKAEVKDVRELVQDAVLEAGQRGTIITVGPMDEPLSARCVPQAVRSALLNLLDNAVDASPKGQPVEVTVERDESGIHIFIADRGPGLPEPVRRQLFSPHVTTKPAGSGMGLFLARQLIVGLHGGRLSIQDHELGGTIAEVVLPATPHEERS